MKRWLIPILVLPGTVLVFVPLAILWFSGGGEFAFKVSPWDSIQFWFGLMIAVLGGFLSGGSMLMFFRHGDGTPAPWDPPKRFVVRGLYRHVRNPMLSGVILLLIAESLFFRSWPLGIWAAIFFAGNSAWFGFAEEPGLARRFGDDYRVYCDNVGRWIPRISPWRPPRDGKAVKACKDRE